MLLVVFNFSGDGLTVDDRGRVQIGRGLYTL